MIDDQDLQLLDRAIAQLDHLDQAEPARTARQLSELRQRLAQHVRSPPINVAAGTRS